MRWLRLPDHVRPQGTLPRSSSRSKRPVPSMASLSVAWAGTERWAMQTKTRSASRLQPLPRSIRRAGECVGPCGWRLRPGRAAPVEARL